MTKYIDADHLIDKILQLQKEYAQTEVKEDNKAMRAVLGGQCFTLMEVVKIIQSLQQERPEVDLEKEIKNGIDNLPNLYCYMEDLFNGNEEEGVYPIPEKVKNELFEFAKHFYELGLKAKGE